MPTAVLFAFFSPGPVQAACSFTAADFRFDCFGEIAPRIEFDPTSAAFILRIENVTTLTLAPVAGDTAIDFRFVGDNGGHQDSGAGRDGDDAIDNLEVDIIAPNLSVTTHSAPGIVVENIGGRGGNSLPTTVTAGHPGGHGGGGGAVSVDVNAHLVETFSGGGAVVQIGSAGGDGGEGGDQSGIADGEGGHGGNGGDGGAVTVAIEAGTQVTSHHNGTHGLFAYSDGGDGGDGGDGHGAGSGRGGNGGEGADAGPVNLTVHGNATVFHNDSNAIFAQSIGGSGGDGGSGGGVVAHGGGVTGSGDGGNVHLTLTGGVSAGLSDGATTNNAGVLLQSIGGFAGRSGDETGIVSYSAGSQSAGNGGDVTANLASGSVVNTNGSYATGVHLQSIGGGGGRAGASTGLVALKSTGSSGGAAGGVGLVGSPSVSTHGDHSDAILLQSIGGGGGSAGNVSGLVAIGGSGKTGSDGSVVEAILSGGSISTQGDYANGMVLQSVGGGGGKADPTWGVVAIGGDGSGGGKGGEIIVSNPATIETHGNGSDGVFLQSVGGGGGHGSSASGILSGFELAIGGNGGVGADGGIITYTGSSTNSITTHGDQSRGLVAQSVGGGGGNGGGDIAAGAGPVNVSIAIGGSGGTSGDGKSVNINSGGAISTAGVNAQAIFAKSSGGGGGSGGFAVSAGESFADIGIAIGGTGGAGGAGGPVSVTSSGNLTTAGDHASAILAQSNGGGGGHSGLAFSGSLVDLGNVAVSIGADGGSGGNAGAVSIASSGSVSTGGSFAYGVHATSVGGSGGGAQAVISADAITVADVEVNVGGDGGAAGNGGAVTVVASNSIGTTGDGSTAITALSVGGGGGHGSFVLAGNGLALGRAGVVVGGSGGASGSADDVMVTSSAEIATAGDNAEGILAQSVGGRGGSSGLLVNANALNIDELEVSVQGSGGSGNHSGDVTVDVTGGTIETQGAQSTAIVARSVGGGGGNTKQTIATTGLSLFVSIGEEQPPVGAINVAVGGAGGDAGLAGDVGVSNAAAITTLGLESPGIDAESVGGAGGYSGLVVATGAAASTGVSGEIAVVVGADGGHGNTAGDVTVTNTGAITTNDKNSFGIFAKSVGGHGGRGTSVVSGILTASDEWSLGGSVNVGGPGGNGNRGGGVSVTNGGAITTDGATSDGIKAMSVGGHGGHGGASVAINSLVSLESNSGTFDVVIGGEGGTGNDAGTASIDNHGQVTVNGAGSAALYASSVGGGGGSGGMAVGAVLGFDQATAKQTNINMTIAVGGSGGAAGDGDHVTVSNTGALSTFGEGGYGIFAASTGGGGGDGGLASSFAFAPTNGCGQACGGRTKFNFTVDVGGTGHGRGDGGVVDVDNQGDIFTQGHTAYGIYASSIGGGGGIGGNGQVGLHGVFSSLDKDARQALNTLAEAGGFGGLAGGTFDSKYQVFVGGDGGVAGDANAVTVTNSADITTVGRSATAIYAQSVGGGGGTAGDGHGGLLQLAVVGGGGSGGGDGGDISVTSTGAINTTATGAMGIFAQSVGGGGGAAGDVEYTLSNNHLDLNIGYSVGGQGDAGGGGNGGAVTVDMGGTLTTSGDNAHGIWAHSVGGSGGASGLDGLAILSALAGSRGDVGDGGAVHVTVSGTVGTTGATAYGIFAQSAGGSGSVGGNVTIDISGTVRSGSSRAILAQSEGGDANGTIAITVQNGGQVIGSELSDGVIYLANGLNNTLVNHGLISDSAELFLPETPVYSLLTTDGQLGFDNHGHFRGSIQLNDGEHTHYSHAIINHANGTMLLGPDIDLGSDENQFENAGHVNAGLRDVIATSEIRGHFFQSGTGVMEVDINLGTNNFLPSADRIIVQAGQLSLDGSVHPRIQPGSVVHSGASGSQFFFQVQDGTITSENLTAVDTATVDFSIENDSLGTAELRLLDFTVDYTPPGLASANQIAFASFLDTLIGERQAELEQGSGDELAWLDDDLATILNQPTVDALSFLYQIYLTDHYFSPLYSSYLAAHKATDVMHSCPGRDGDGILVFDRQGSCAWVKGIYQHTRDTSPLHAFTEDAYGFAIGGQTEVGRDVFLGLGAFYEQLDIDGHGTNVGNGQRIQLNAIGKWEPGPWTLSAKLGVSSTNIDHTRQAPNGVDSIESEQDITMLSAHLRAAYEKSIGSAYVRPSLAAMFDTYFHDDIQEGGSDASAYVDDWTHTTITLNPRLEVGTDLSWANVNARLFAQAGFLWLVEGEELSHEVAFAGSNTPLTLSDELEDIIGDFSIGVNAQIGEDLALKLSGNWQVGHDVEVFGAMAKLSLNF